jgi:hypothetical protein
MNQQAIKPWLYGADLRRFSTARKMLYGLSNDWFVKSGIIQAERLANNTRKVKISLR